MPTYMYKVKSQTGKILSGEAKTDTKEELIKLLAMKEFVPIEINEKNFMSDITQIAIFKPRVKVKDLSMFCRQFSIVLEAGLPIATAMDVIKNQTVNATLKEALTDIYESIQKGNSLSSSMRKHDVFPDLLVNMVESGEISGQLDAIFKRMAEFFEKDYKIQKKIKSAMIYPAVLCSISVIVVYILMSFVLPEFVKTLESFNTELPLPTKIVIGVSNFFGSYWYVPLVAGISAFFGLRVYLKSYTGKKNVSSLMLKIPVLRTLTKNIITARFTRTLSTLLLSGVLLIEALEMVQKIIGNVVVSEKFEDVLTEVKKGKGLTYTLNNMKFFPPLLISMIKVGEESGGLDSTLEKSADYFDQEVDASISQFLTLLEPFIILVLGAIVGFIVVSVLMPMMSMYEGVSTSF